MQGAAAHTSEIPEEMGAKKPLNPVRGSPEVLLLPSLPPGPSPGEAAEPVSVLCWAWGCGKCSLQVGTSSKEAVEQGGPLG